MKGQLRLLGGRKLDSPRGLMTRPTPARVREAVMNFLGEKIHGCHWLDLCSGSGVMSCEALERGASRILAVEKNPQTAKICKSNLMTIASDLSDQKFVEVICREVISLLKKGCDNSHTGEGADSKFDIVYLDPPYESKIYSIVLEKLLEGNWLKQNSLVICEHSTTKELNTPREWCKQGKRVYGNTSLLIISPP